MNGIQLGRIGRFFLVFSALIIGLLSIYFTAKITYPFIIAFFIAFLINPAVNFLEHKARLPRTLSVLISLFVIISILAGAIILLIAEIVSGAEYLAKTVPHHLQTLIDFSQKIFAAQLIPFYNELAKIFNRLDPEYQQTIMNYIENIGASLSTSSGQFIREFFEKIPSLISWVPNAGTVIVFAVLATFFISKDWYRLQSVTIKLFPKNVQSGSIFVLHDLKKAFFGFLKAQFTLISITTAIILIGLLILRVDYALLIALITGLVDIIPYLGTGVVFVPWIIYEAIAGEAGRSIGLAVLYGVVILTRQMIEPKILSANIGLNPLATLISLFIGFKLAGFIGLIAGPVVLVVIMTLYRANVFQNLWAYIKG